jgi:hypothetical protein
MCRGTLDDMEAQAVRVAEKLGVGIPYPIQVYYGELAVDKHCAGATLPLSGCARGLDEDTYIAANPSSIFHELVHAIRWVNGRRGPRFFEEGIAEVLSAFWPLPYRVEVQADAVERGPEFLASLPSSDFQPFDYDIAGHFMSWLSITHGDVAMAAFLNDEELATDATAAFVRNFGLSLHDAEAAWRSSSERIYSFGERCDPLLDLAWDGATLEFNGNIDCDAPNTTGPIGDMMNTRVHCFTLDKPSTLRIELIARGGQATLQCRELADGSALAPDYFQTKTVLAGEAIDLPFAPCMWRLFVKTDVTEPGDFSLRLTQL